MRAIATIDTERDKENGTVIFQEGDDWTEASVAVSDAETDDEVAEFEERPREWPFLCGKYTEMEGETDSIQTLSFLSVLETIQDEITNVNPISEYWSKYITKNWASRAEPRLFPLFTDLARWKDLKALEEFESPLDMLEVERHKDIRLLQIIQDFREYTVLSYGQRLADRLEFLLEEQQAEYPEDWEFSIQSLRGFLTFISDHPYLKYPDVCLSPDGLIMVQWRESENRDAILEFQDENEVQFVLFAPSEVGVSRIRGTSTSDEALKTFETYGADKWCKR